MPALPLCRASQGPGQAAGSLSKLFATVSFPVARVSVARLLAGRDAPPGPPGIRTGAVLNRPRAAELAETRVASWRDIRERRSLSSGVSGLRLRLRKAVLCAGVACGLWAVFRARNGAAATQPLPGRCRPAGTLLPRALVLVVLRNTGLVRWCLGTPGHVGQVGQLGHSGALRGTSTALGSPCRVLPVTV